MSIHELDAKVKNLRELRNFEAEIKAEIAAIEDEIKAENAGPEHRHAAWTGLHRHLEDGHHRPV